MLIEHEASTNGQVENFVPGRGRVQALLDTVLDHASRPLEESAALPGEWYTNEALYQLEVERIFKKDWIYVARADELAKPGDWLSAEIAGEALMLVRGEDGEIRAMSRVCPHRFTDVLAEAEHDHGNCNGFVCPYHAWAFNLQGRMTGAPLMQRSKLFERERDSYCLKPFATEVWHGFVFVNLDQDAEPLAPRLADLEEVIGPYRLDEWRIVERIDWPESPANWKIVMDNGRECYHHLGAHRESVEPIWPAHLVDADTNDSKYCFWQRLHVDPSAAVGEEDGHLINPVVFPPLEGLTPFQRSHYLLLGVYPSMWFAPGPDMLLTARWLPTGPRSHKFDLTISVHESQLDHPDFDSIVAESKVWVHQIQTEDSRIVLSIQKMLDSQLATRRGGPFSHLERPMWQFQKYMAHRLIGADV